LLWQTLHCPPPVPHALEALPLLHWLFWQQPLEQLDAPQEPEVGTHPPLMHFSLLLHILQAPPLLPHELTLEPPMQLAPMQQPLAQLEGPQVAVLGWHSPSLQTWLVVQTLHP